MMATPLPRTVRFHRRFIVRIRVISAAEMRQMSGGGDGYSGVWIVEKMTILIRKASPRKQLEVCSHELVHAAIDFNYLCRHGKI